MADDIVYTDEGVRAHSLISRTERGFRVTLRTPEIGTLKEPLEAYLRGVYGEFYRGFELTSPAIDVEDGRKSVRGYVIIEQPVRGE